MKVAVLHDGIASESSPDQQDILAQIETVGGSLQRLGHQVLPVEFSFRLPQVMNSLSTFSPDVVFNLVESVGGNGQLIHLAPAVLDHMRIPYTGCPLGAIFLSTDKILAKRLLFNAGLPTPNWWTPEEGPAEAGDSFFIVKSLWEDASIGIDDNSVVFGLDSAREKIREKETSFGGKWFAEAYIEGREFNVSIVEEPTGPRVLPLAEIRFLDFPEGKPKMVGYRAKWEEESFEYLNTPRTFSFPQEDEPLLKSLSKQALAAWKIFGFRGYGRVDFRVGLDGSLYILELNCNPCLSPDSGFMAACLQDGMAIEDTVSLILAAVRR